MLAPKPPVVASGATLPTSEVQALLLKADASLHGSVVRGPSSEDLTGFAALDDLRSPTGIGSVVTPSLEALVARVPRAALEVILVELMKGLGAAVHRTASSSFSPTLSPHASCVMPLTGLGSVAISLAASAAPSKPSSPVVPPLTDATLAPGSLTGRRASLQVVDSSSATTSCNFGSGTYYSGTATSFREITQLEADEDLVGNAIVNEYTLIAEIGRGACGVVKLAVHNDQPTDLYAIKILKRSLLKQVKRGVGLSGVLVPDPLSRRASRSTPLSGLFDAGSVSPRATRAAAAFDNACHEVAVMKKLRHRNIVTLHSVIDDPASNEMYLIMDYIPHGTVVKHATTIKGTGEILYHTVSEKRLRRYLPQLIDGLRYLHKHGIVHRDLKPENILLGENQRIFIADFGVAELVAPGEALNVYGTVGTPLFWPPEMFSATSESWNGAAQDCWALACTLYIMIYGRHPFFGVGYLAIKENVCSASLQLPAVPKVSESLQSLLRTMLDKDPHARPSLEMVRGHPFLAGTCRPPPTTPVLNITDAEYSRAIAEGRHIHPHQRQLLLRRRSRETVQRYVQSVRDRVQARRSGAQAEAPTIVLPPVRPALLHAQDDSSHHSPPPHGNLSFGTSSAEGHPLSCSLTPPPGPTSPFAQTIAMTSGSFATPRHGDLAQDRAFLHSASPPSADLSTRSASKSPELPEKRLTRRPSPSTTPAQSLSLRPEGQSETPAVRSEATVPIEIEPSLVPPEIVRCEPSLLIPELSTAPEDLRGSPGPDGPKAPEAEGTDVHVRRRHSLQAAFPEFSARAARKPTEGSRTKPSTPTSATLFRATSWTSTRLGLSSVKSSSSLCGSSGTTPLANRGERHSVSTEGSPQGSPRHGSEVAKQFWARSTATQRNSLYRP